MYNTNIHVNISKHTAITYVYTLEEAGFIKDYSTSNEHRYKIAGSKNFKNVVGPSKCLHLSNICELVDENFIRSLFAPVAPIISFCYFKGTKKMAVASFSSVAQATNVLVNYHNYDI